MPSDWANADWVVGHTQQSGPASFRVLMVARQFLGISRPPVLGMVARQFFKERWSLSERSLWGTLRFAPGAAVGAPCGDPWGDSPGDPRGGSPRGSLGGIPQGIPRGIPGGVPLGSLKGPRGGCMSQGGEIGKFRNCPPPQDPLRHPRSVNPSLKKQDGSHGSGACKPCVRRLR